ncbi:uncharacterized protein LOC121293805 [Carcharodon carcharias]|uniref:uncharacterized protein LOC121293805 n=1 Tax=Carcharodon carcharias TaxID=13397 RepID=UPI001B7DA8CA|nr:uncharacterized protein LOC121293805 [Carcharodon carcharias]
MTAAVKQVPLTPLVQQSWKDRSENITGQEPGDQSCITDFCNLTPGGKYLQLVTKNVNTHKGKLIPLRKGLPIIIGDLDDTVYWGRPDMLKCWEDLYLPQRMEMVVLGTIDGYPSLAPGLQLVILAGKDGPVFAYEEEMLHKIANNLKQLFTEGVTFPGTEIYEYGRGFRPKTNEEYQSALKEAGLEKISQDTRDFISKNAAEMKQLIDDLNFL